MHLSTSESLVMRFRHFTTRTFLLFFPGMDNLVCWIARALVAVIQALPMRLVARIGRAGGAVLYLLDRRHRRVALKNLTMCFGREKSAEEIRALARENFRRLGENYLTAVKSAAMSFEEIQRHLSFTGGERVAPPPPGGKPRSVILAIGHFGNFELYARLVKYMPEYKVATTYRGLRQPGLNRLMQSLRETSGCLYFDRRTQGDELKELLGQPGVLLGLLTDQRTVQGALRLPFLGHECSTNAAPAIFTRRYRAALHTCICQRTGLAQWRLEMGPEIPTRENGQARSTEALMRDIHQALEAAVRRDPANWFWVHNRWKLPQPEAKASKATATNWETVTQ